MLSCSFSLNGKPMSSLVCGAQSFDAFSGLGQSVNNPAKACVASEGPIPPGTYYIVDRASGGLLGSFRDWLSDKDVWFALYADDGSVDDGMLCDKVKRGQFRLHPKGPRGISLGCITLEKRSDFDLLRASLLSVAKETIPGSTLQAYGKVVVK